jgi:DNA-binding NtrC family response regulator
VNRNLCVLVVDDEPTIRLSLQTILQRAGYQVYAAADGAEAIAHIRQRRFSVAVIDLVLPDLDGLAVLETARRLQPDCRCLVLTAYAIRKKALEAIEKGAIDYIVKPAPVQEILARVNHAAMS